MAPPNEKPPSPPPGAAPAAPEAPPAPDHGTGDDDAFHHDLTPQEKDGLEAPLRAQARELLQAGDKKARQRKLAQANEISRRKSKRAHQHGI